MRAYPGGPADSGLLVQKRQLGEGLRRIGGEDAIDPMAAVDLAVGGDGQCRLRQAAMVDTVEAIAGETHPAAVPLKAVPSQLQGLEKAEHIVHGALSVFYLGRGTGGSGSDVVVQKGDAADAVIHSQGIGISGAQRQCADGCQQYAQSAYQPFGRKLFHDKLSFHGPACFGKLLW